MKHLLKSSVLILLMTASTTPDSRAQSYFDNGGGDGLWSTTTNWNPDGTPSGTITIANGLSATSNADVSLGAGTTVLIGYNTNPYGIGSGPGGNGVLNVTAGNMTFNGGAGQTFGMALGSAGQPQTGTLNISGTGTVSIQSGDLMVGWINATGEAVRGSGLIDVQTGGTLNISNAGNQCIGFQADGKLKISGGTVNQSGSTLRFSAGGGILSSFEMTGGAFNIGQEVRFGDAFASFSGTQSGGAIIKSAASVGNLAMFVDEAPGSYVQTGGSIDVEDTVGCFNVGWNSHSDLTPYGGQVYTLNGGTASVGVTSQAGFRVAVGSLNATANVQSGSLTVGASSLYGLRLGEDFGGVGNGFLNVSGGNVTVNGAGMYLGVDAGCTGTVNQTGGTVTVAAGLTLTVGNTPTATGTYNLDGGTLVVSSVAMGGTGSAFNFGSGTLRNNGNLTTVAPMNLTGNGTWDTAGYNATQSATLSGSGGLTKAGAGTLAVSGSNTYVGDTTVTAGTMLVNNTSGSGLGSGNVTVNGGTLGGSGAFSGSVTVNTSGTLAPGSSIQSLASGALTFNTGSTFGYEVDSSVATSVGADLQVVGGSLDLNGTVTLTLSNLAAGTFANATKFTLINYSGTWNNGLFTYNSTVLNNLDTFAFNGQTWQIEYNAGAGGVNFSAEFLPASSFVNITVVPEPTTWVLTALGLTATMVFRRRRQG